MGSVRICRVVSCTEASSSKNSADNLLSTSCTLAWTGKAGESEHAVILQLEAQVQISSIDVGDAFSAFIEILVGSSSSSTERLQVLIPRCALMDPIESRNGTNGNRVRIFSSDEMIPSIAAQKWDRIKIVCAQPFNETIPYGLSFIRILAENESPSPPRPAAIVPVPALALKPAIVKDDEIVAGSLFAKRALLAEQNQENSIALNEKERNLTTKKNVGKRERSVEDSKTTAKKVKEKKGKEEKDTTRNETASRVGTAESTEKSREDGNAGKKAKRDEEATTSNSLDRVLNGVHVCLSGFVNPQRASLRDMALSLGARYDVQWLPDSTHLVCAFSKTPKRAQAGNEAVVVSADWIVQCHRRRRRLEPSRFPPPP